MSKPTLFIVGVTGTIGKATLQHLNKNHFHIKGGSRDAEKAKKLQQEDGIEGVVVDSNKKNTLVSAFKGVNYLLIVPSNDQNRGDQMVHAIEAAKEAGVEVIVLFSVADAQDKRILFQRQFAQGEDKLKSSGVNYVILQAPWFQENALGSKDGVYLPLRNGATTFASVYDLGRTIARVLENPKPHFGKTYIMTGPALTTGKEIAKALSDVQGGKDVPYHDIPPQDFKNALKGYGISDWQVDGILELIEGYANRKSKITNHIQQITGVAPRSFAETAKAAFGGK